MTDEPKLLCIPEHFRSVDDMLAVAGKLKLGNALLISEREDGSLVFLDTSLTVAEANWLIDRMKVLMLVPSCHQRLGVVT
jgi:uncharacterized protein YerC